VDEAQRQHSVAVIELWICRSLALLMDSAPQG
jgi:hypothetical protein